MRKRNKRYIEEAAEVVSIGLSKRCNSSELICDMENPLLHPYQTNFYHYIVEQLRLMFNIKWRFS